MVKSIGLREKPFHRGTRVREGKTVKTYVGIVLDRSGSMQSLQSEVVGAFNDQVDAIKKMAKEQDVKVTLVTFSTTVDEATLLHRDARHLKPLYESNYRPDGMTSLFDAMGDTITEFKRVEDYDDPDVAFLLIVITDGEENSSKRFSRNDIRRLVDDTNEDGRWTITYLGTNQNVLAVTQSIGLKIGNAGAWNFSNDGLREASRSLTYAIGNYGDSRLRGDTAVNCFYSNTSVGLANADNADDDNKSNK